jgi:PadR family transcriptional regulator, regulatory protein PadR
MSYKYGCDMRGMLSFQIMWLLSKKHLHGEEIAKEIEKRRGDKPKAGTLYPALKELKENKLIKGSKKGKTITYSLTPKGKEALKHAIVYFCRSFGDVFEEEGK